MRACVSELNIAIEISSSDGWSWSKLYHRVYDQRLVQTGYINYQARPLLQSSGGKKQNNNYYSSHVATATNLLFLPAVSILEDLSIFLVLQYRLLLALNPT